MSRFRKTTAVAASVALVASAGLGAAQAATSSKDRAASSSQQRPGGKRGPSTAELNAIASKLQITTAQLRSAMQATRPAKPTGERRGRGADRAAAIATALGADVAKVEEILEANRPQRPATPPANGERPPKPDQTALIEALADGLGLEQSAVKAALDKLEADHRAEHEQRHTAMYTALAEKLGLEVAAVKAAFEAARPAKPTR